MIRNIRSFFSRSRRRARRPSPPALCRGRRGAALLLGLLLLTGCAGGETDTASPLRVGVALYAQDDTFISSVSQYLERLVQDAEVERGKKINLTMADGASNQTTQMEQVDRFLSRGCDVLCVNIVDRTAAAVLIDRVEEAGIPLIFFNRQPVAEDIDYRERVYYVGTSAQESGTLQGQLVLDAWRADPAALDRSGDGVLQYVMLEGEPGHQDSLLRTEYSVKALTDAGVSVEKLAGDAANWNRGQASLRMQQWLSEFGGQIEVVFANNDDMALGAIDVLRDWPGPFPLVVGVDGTAPALEAMAEGTLYGTVYNDARGMAQAMLDLILTLSSGQDPGPELQDGHYIWLPHIQISRDNLADFLPEGQG